MPSPVLFIPLYRPSLQNTDNKHPRSAETKSTSPSTSTPGTYQHTATNTPKHTKTFNKLIGTSMCKTTTQDSFAKSAARQRSSSKIQTKLFPSGNPNPSPLLAKTLTTTPAVQMHVLTGIVMSVPWPWAGDLGQPISHTLFLLIQH